MLAAPFVLSLTFVPIAFMGLVHGGLWTVACAIYGLVVLVAVVARLAGLNTANPGVETKGLLWHRALTWAWVPIQLAMLLGLAAEGGRATPLNESELVAAAAAIGLLTGGVGIAYAHELMHRTNRFERALAEMLTTSILYGHFCIEHLAGHHMNVATPNDPATARFGESFYRFLPRAVFGSLFSAWRIQCARLELSGRPIWHPSNAFWRYAGAFGVYLGAAYALGGVLGVKLFLVQACVAILVLENINYVEHYGLMRRPLGAGRYEPVQPHHSWRPCPRFANKLSIDPQRRPDSHKNPGRRYPALQQEDEMEAPRLPFGYPAMLVIALAPPLWFGLMNPRVLDWHCLFWEQAKAQQDARERTAA
jgi:alkane 1-monooxygenase